MERLSTVLYSLYRGSPGHGPWVVSVLAGAWPALLGEQISRACRPASWDRHCLTVEVVDEDWSESLRSLHSEILRRVREATGGEVLEVRFVSGSR